MIFFAVWKYLTKEQILLPLLNCRIFKVVIFYMNFLSQKLPAIVEQIFFQRKSDCCLSYTLLLVITEKINHFHYFQLLKILGFTCCKYYANSILLNRASKNLLCKLYMSYGYTLHSFQLLLNTKIENIRVAEDSFSVYNSWHMNTY